MIDFIHSNTQPNSPINSKFLSHNDHNQYCSMCFQGNQVSWYFCGSCKKARETTHRNWNVSIPVPRIVGNCFHRGLCRHARLLCLKSNWWWHKLLYSIAKCSLFGDVDAVIRSMIRHYFSLPFTWSISSQFSRRFETAIWCEGKEAKADTLTDLFWVFNVAYFVLRIFTENFLFFSIRSPKQAFLF